MCKLGKSQRRGGDGLEPVILYYSYLFAKNMLNIDSVDVICDYRMFWLMKNEIEFTDRVSNMYCKNNSSYFFDLTAKDFDNCQTF